MKIKICDRLFSHAEYSTDYQKSKYIEWDRNPINIDDKFIVYTEKSFSDLSSSNNKIAWLLESPAITNHNWIKDNYHLFDMVFTNNKELLDIGDKFKFVPTGGCWIKPEDHYVYPKSKKISMITSDKYWTDGHKMRLSIMEKFKEIDFYGRSINPINYKLDGLKDYRFSVVAENTKKDYYFTEKLIDCFMTGTIPIYWGCPSIGNYFDERGMIIFDTLEDLEKIMWWASPEIYNLKLEYVRKNFEIAKDYLIAEDYMYEKYLKFYD